MNHNLLTFFLLIGMNLLGQGDASSDEVLDDVSINELIKTKKCFFEYQQKEVIDTLKQNQSSLHINIGDCRYEQSFEYVKYFKVYKKDSVLLTLSEKHENEVNLQNLSYGTYRIEYKSIYGKIENIILELTENKIYTVEVCLDYMNYELETYLPFIDQLKNNESYYIHISSQGCFHFSNENLSIKRKENDYYLTFQEHEKLLSKEEVLAIRHFEMELNYMESRGCTSTDKFVLKYKNKEVTITDGSCSWNGAYYLLENLQLSND